MLLKRSLSLFLCAVLTLSLCVFSLPRTARAANESLNIADGNILVEPDGTGWKATQNNVTKNGAMTDTLTISGTGTTSPTAHAIIIGSDGSVGSVAAPMPIVLDNVHIQTAYDAVTAPDPPNALKINPASHVSLTLVGTNTLAFKGNYKAAVRVPETSSLTITGGGSLTAECILLQTDSICLGAAIGGDGSILVDGEACGTVKINGSANVTATCDTLGGYGAGIGGGGVFGPAGGKGGDGGTVEVSGQATVTARSNYGAGVGSGGARGRSNMSSTSGNGGTVTVNGGSLTAVSSDGAGIGSGYGSSACGHGGSLTVQNGSVIATSTNGAGVGGGSSQSGTGGNGGSVTMTGGELRAKSTNGVAVGGGKGTATGTSGSVDLEGFVDSSGKVAYEWSRVENVPYIVFVDSDTKFPNNNALGFAGIRKAGVTISPIMIDFDTRPSGYTVRPDKQWVRLTNTGTEAVTPRGLSSTAEYAEYYDIETPSNWNTPLNAGASRRFSVQPKEGLSTGPYDVTIPIATNASTRGLYVIFAVGTPPTISGNRSITLTEGYSGPRYEPYTVSGDPAPNVAVDPSRLEIVWDDTSNRLKINTGLPAGVYDFDLVAFNGIAIASLPVTITVNAAPSINGPTALALTAGYDDTSTSEYTIFGYPAPTVTFASSDGSITWDEGTKKISVAPGLPVGSYTAVLTATNSEGAATHTLTITVNPAPVPPVPPAPSGGGSSISGGGAYTGNQYPGSFAMGANGGPVLTVQAPCEKCISVIVDGVQLKENADYTKVCGSTIVTFTPSYLATLANGTHSIRVQFTDGRYDGNFVTPFSAAIAAAPMADVPATGDVPILARLIERLRLRGMSN